MKCRPTRSTPRVPFRTAALLAVLATLTLPAAVAAPQPPIVPPDAAVRPFLEGRELVEKGRYGDAVPKLEQALATGHEQPRERFGTSRHPVDYYDPHYWLGRALMELGDEKGALGHLRASAAGGAFPDRRETEDRNRRIAELERREAERREPLRPEPTAAPALPLPTPVSPVSTPAPPEPGPVAGASAGEAATPLPAPRVALPSPAASPRPWPGLSEAVAALAAGDFGGAADRVRLERRRSPGVPELDLIEAAALGSRYVVEGRRDETLLATARTRLSEFRRKGGSARAETTLLSPALRALLEPR